MHKNNGPPTAQIKPNEQEARYLESQGLLKITPYRNHIGLQCQHYQWLNPQRQSRIRAFDFSTEPANSSKWNRELRDLRKAVNAAGHGNPAVRNPRAGVLNQGQKRAYGTATSFTTSSDNRPQKQQAHETNQSSQIVSLAVQSTYSHSDTSRRPQKFEPPFRTSMRKFQEGEEGVMFRYISRELLSKKSEDPDALTEEEKVLLSKQCDEYAYSTKFNERERLLWDNTEIPRHLNSTPAHIPGRYSRLRATHRCFAEKSLSAPRHGLQQRYKAVLR